MKKILALFILAVTCTAPAQLQTNVFSTSVNVLIPDANPTGYVSTRLVSGVGVAQYIQSISVSLDITGGFNGDLYAYLAFGNSFVVLLNRAGKTASDPYGYDDAGFNITLSDSAAIDIHNYGGNGGLQLSGNWRPDGRAVDPQLVLDTDLRQATFSSFTNINPNGTWTLFVADMATGYQSTLVDWSLTIVTVPEPPPARLFALLAGIIAIGRWRLNARHK